jgi:hydroxyacylglutathione hydrolase
MFQIKVLTFNPVEENTYVLYDDRNECIIIDPGCYYDQEKEELKSFIATRQLRPKMLLNTHCHLDHVFGNKFIAEEYKLPLRLHKNEEQVLQMAPASGLMFNLPFDNYEGPLIFLKEGEVVSLLNDKLKIIEAPGHSPGSICFYCEEQKFLIGGDVLFQNSIGRTDLPGGSFEDLVRNIRDKLFKLPEQVTVYPGHGPETTIEAEMKYNPFLI